MNIDKIICDLCLQTYEGNCDNCKGRKKFKQKILQGIGKVIDVWSVKNYNITTSTVVNELKEKLGIKEGK